MARRAGLQQQPARSRNCTETVADADDSKHSTVLSLLFSLEAGDVAEKLSSSVPYGLSEYDPVSEVQRINTTMAALSYAECKLAEAVREAKASSILTTGSVQLGHVGSYLRSRYGYLVAIRHANAVKRPRTYLRMLQHKYLVVRGLENLEDVDVLVDLNFRDHFVLPHSTGWYSKLLAALPHDWVGTAAGLAPLVGLMSAGMRLCFKQAGVPLPPWREARAVLSRWLPEAYREDAPPLVPLPDTALRRMLAPYHGAPFRSALQRAAASELQAVAGGRAAGAGQAGAVTRCGRQQLAGSGRPPLPRPPSGVALATASVKAAAAGAAAGVQQQAGAGAGHSQHGHFPVAPDVPRKIIVGFPDQNVLPTSKCVTAAATATGVTAAAAAAQHYGVVVLQGGADAGVLVIRQQQQLGCHQQRVPAGHAAKQQQPTAAGSSVSAPADQQQQQQQQASEATVRRGRPAGGLVALQQLEAVPVGRLSSGAAAACAAVFRPPCSFAALRAEQSTTNEVAAAAAAKPPAARGCQWKPCVQQEHQAASAEALAQPDLTSAAVVPASSSSTSLAVTSSQQLLRQQQDAPLLVAQQQQQQQERLHAVDKNNGAEAGISSPAAALPALHGRLRQFKALDQLLPRIRTVRLGAV